jgi:hypothetical protein
LLIFLVGTFSRSSLSAARSAPWPCGVFRIGFRGVALHGAEVSSRRAISAWSSDRISFQNSSARIPDIAAISSMGGLHFKGIRRGVLGRTSAPLSRWTAPGCDRLEIGTLRGMIVCCLLRRWGEARWCLQRQLQLPE